MKKILAGIAITLFVICILAVVFVLVGIANWPVISDKGTPASPTAKLLSPEPGAGKKGHNAPLFAPPPPTPEVPPPPIMLARFPERGQEQSLEDPIIITFDQAMDKASVEAAFHIEPEVSGKFTWELEGRRLIFTPEKPLERGQVYKVNVDESAKSALGLPLREPASFRFTTVGFLEVVEVQPAPDTTEVDMKSIVTVIFNRPVVPLVALSKQTELPHPLTFTPQVMGEGEWLNTSIYVFRPEEGFAPATRYKARVNAGLQDTTGGLLAEDYSWIFTTKLPAVADTLPYHNDVYVNPATVITVTFNQPMNKKSAQEHFSLEEYGEPVEGDFRWPDESTMVFAPARPLKIGTTYTAQVLAGAMGKVGNVGTQEDYTWSFTTIELPYIVSTFPADGETDVDPYGGVEVLFSSPMNEETFPPNLTILPQATNVYSYWSRYNTRLWFTFDQKPRSTYTITIGAGLQGRYGHKLGRDYTFSYTTGDLSPYAYLISTGDIGAYNAYTETVAYVRHRNVSRLDFALYRLRRTDLFRFVEDYWWESWEKFKPDRRDLVRAWSKELEAPPNVARLFKVKLAELGGALPPGLYYFEVSSPDTDPSRQVLVVSRYNVTLKQGNQEALAWVTDLKSGQPVSGLEVIFYDKRGGVLARSETDQGGVCTASYDRLDTWEPFFAFVGRSDWSRDFALAINRWNDGISPWDFDLSSESYSELYKGHFYTDRPIYRPGQKVYFKGIIRADDDAHYSLPNLDRKVHARVENSQGEEIYSTELTLSEVGTVHGELSLDEEAPLGYYYLSATYDEQSFWADFQVAEYRKPEFEVSIKTDRDEYVHGDEIAVSVEARYYFGGPVQNARVRWAFLRDDYFFQWKGKGWYDFTDYDWTQYRYYGAYGEFVGEGEGKTDSEGRFTFKVPANIAEKITSQLYTIEATVIDVNDQEVSARTEAIVHKGLFYIGLRPQSYVGQVGKEQKVDIITIDWESNPVPKVGLEVVFYTHKWYSVKEQAEDGQFYWTSKYVDTPIFTTTVTTDAEGKAVAAFTPKEGGVYKVSASGLDEKGNRVRSSTYMWVSGFEYVNWRQEENNRIDLVSDKKSYKPGDVVQILIPSPYQGSVKALLTIERGRIIEQKVITLKTNSDLVEIPITSEHIPNIFVSAVIVKGMDKTSPMPSFRVGYVKLPVSAEEKELKLVITPDKPAGEHYAPRETVTYEVRALDYKGKGVEAELSLVLADLSVLALAGERGPSLMNTFWLERGLGIQTACSLIVSIEERTKEIAEEAKGGGGGPAGEGFVRRRFPDTAYWNPAVHTNKEGKAKVSVELPDTLTTWRLSAKAITADTEVGETKVDVVSTLDLLIRPVAPRFFIVGDEVLLGAIVHNNTDQPLKTKVSLQAEGLKLEEEAEKVVEVPAHGLNKVRWPVSVQDAQKAVLLYRAAGGELSDAVEITLPIHRYSTPEVVATAGTLDEDGSRLELVYLPERLDPSQGELMVELDPSLAAGMQDGLKYLETFPYYCIEQTVSRFLPNVMTYRALKELGIEKQELETKLAQYVSVGLQRLYALQHYDGGWGWWLNDESNPWLTAYVLLGLVEAQRADFAVEEDVMEDAAKFLRESFLQPTDVLHPYQANTQAFVLYVLAEYGKGDLGRSVTLFEQRERLGNYGKAFLVIALARLEPEEETRVNALLSDLTSAAILSQTGAHWEEKTVDYWTMNTDTRSTAIVLDAFARLHPESPLAANAVRWLMVARKEGHWETTQETAWSLIALTDYMAATGELKGDYSYQVNLNEEKWGEGTVTPKNVDEAQKLKVAIAELLREEANKVRIDRFSEGEQTGEGRLYYSMYLRYFLPVQDIKALNRGIIVARQYTYPEEDEWIDEAEVGEVIRVKLTIIAPNDLHYFILEDPLPAGCEALDQSLKTTTVVGQRPEIKRTDKWDRWGWGWWWFSHTEVRDEKVVLFATYLPRGTYEYTYLMRASVPGQFQVIPALAYEFYFPEVFGRSDGGMFTVNPSEE